MTISGWMMASRCGSALAQKNTISTMWTVEHDAQRPVSPREAQSAKQKVPETIFRDFQSVVNRVVAALAGGRLGSHHL